MHRLIPALTIVSFLASPAVSLAAAEGPATRAFERLKELEGTWTGTASGEGAEAEAEAEMAGEVVHTIRVSAGGTVVMETMNPGTEHEMINMYHLDGEELVLTHYCAGGNQPSMRMVAGEGGDDILAFDFTGGSNMDPAVDPHIHSARITFEGPDTLVSFWESRTGGEPGGAMTFRLTRSD